MKLTEALTQIFPATVFTDNDLSAVIGASALKDIDLPDSVMQKFNSHYLTRDRAENDTEIVKSLKTKHWGYFADTIEKDLKKIVQILPDEWQTKYYAIPETQVNGIYDRIKVVTDAVNHLKEKGAGEDVKTVSEKFRKQIEQLHKDLESEQKIREKEKSEFESKEQGIKMNYALRSKLTGYLPKLDPNIIKTDIQKNFIIDSAINSLQSEYLLEFDKENQSAINFMKKDRTDVYEGNTKLTLDKHIEKLLEPYIVKNPGGNPPAPDKSDRKPLPTNNGLTLQEKMWARAQA